MTYNNKHGHALQELAKTLVGFGKGILAADESVAYMHDVFATIGLENTEENRRCYREVLFTSHDLQNYISGVILQPETVYQKTKNGVLFVELLKQQGIIPGVNIDKGLVLLDGTDGETTTQGLDYLEDRCKEFKENGCYFAKWRCSFKIGLNIPSSLAVKDNATVLARYASVCQANGLVPIIEPEIQIQGDHDLHRAQEVTEVVLSDVYNTLKQYNVCLEETLLKPSMVLPGKSCHIQYTSEDIAQATVTAMLRCVPSAVPGIGFLSGGQTPDEATKNLLHINRNPCSNKKPWFLTFIFGRALQKNVAMIWKGNDKNIILAQSELIRCSKDNSDASTGHQN